MFTKSGKTFTENQNSCQDKGGDLVSMETEEEWTFINSQIQALTLAGGVNAWQIGLRKAVGAKQLDIFWQFLTESVCLCLCGGVLGIVFGWLLAHGVARVAIRMVPIVPQWPVVLPLNYQLTDDGSIYLRRCRGPRAAGLIGRAAPCPPCYW